MGQSEKVERSGTGLAASWAMRAVFLAAALSAWWWPIVAGPGSRPVSSIEVIEASAFAAFMALLIEYQIERQLSLAQNGIVTQAIIDEVRRRGWSQECPRCFYHFIATDGQWIESRCTMSIVDDAVLERGSHVQVIYDPERPQRNMLPMQMWAVQWADELGSST